MLGYVYQKTPPHEQAQDDRQVRHPGWVQTDLGGKEAPLQVADGAKTAVMLATLPADGPTGQFLHLSELLPW
jgi:hypothetical protein